MLSHDQKLIFETRIVLSLIAVIFKKFTFGLGIDIASFDWKKYQLEFLAFQAVIRFQPPHWMSIHHCLERISCNWFRYRGYSIDFNVNIF